MTKTEFTSYLDTLSGREGNHDKKQECEVVYITIQEAARRCGVNPKTIQRAIRAGTLPASYPFPNRCEIAVSDLDTFMPGHVQTATKQHVAEQVSGHVQAELEQRIAELEERVQQLEHQITELLDMPAVPKRLSKAKARERTAGPLPKQFVSLLAFAELHRVAESKILAHVDLGLLPVKRGEWTDANRTVVTLALDVKGRAAFSQLYQEMPFFMRCKQCPHHLK